MTLQACELLVKHFEKRQRSPNPSGLSHLGFDMLLSSDINSMINPRHSTLYQPMDLPLTHYFVASSHNTYLEGDQLTGESSTDMYAAVLKSGCRSIECKFLLFCFFFFFQCTDAIFERSFNSLYVCVCAFHTLSGLLGWSSW
jgi:hypothetical protein